MRFVDRINCKRLELLFESVAFSDMLLYHHNCRTVHDVILALCSRHKTEFIICSIFLNRYVSRYFKTNTESDRIMPSYAAKSLQIFFNTSDKCEKMSTSRDTRKILHALKCKFLPYHFDRRPKESITLLSLKSTSVCR